MISMIHDNDEFYDSFMIHGCMVETVTYTTNAADPVHWVKEGPPQLLSYTVLVHELVGPVYDSMS